MTFVLAVAATKPEPIDAAPLIKAFVEGLLEAAVALWPILLLIGLAALGKLVLEVRRLRRLARSGIKDIDAMDGTTFEIYLTTLFERLGYRVEHTGRHGDYGADLVVVKSGRRTAVQAKRWSKNVGLGAVQEVTAATSLYSCDSALVVSNQRFTVPARKLAKANRVELWGREELISRILSLGGPAPIGGPSLAVLAECCATCGVSVSEKVRDYCLTRPTRFGGRIYCFRHQRATR